MKIVLANVATPVINQAITRDSSSSNTKDSSSSSTSHRLHLRSSRITTNVRVFSVYHLDTSLILFSEAPDKKPDHQAWFDFDDEKKHQLEVSLL